MKLVSYFSRATLELISQCTLDQVHSESEACSKVFPRPTRDHGAGKKFPLISAVKASTDRAAVTAVLHLLPGLTASFGAGNLDEILLSMSGQHDVLLRDSLGGNSS